MMIRTAIPPVARLLLAFVLAFVALLLSANKTLAETPTAVVHMAKVNSFDIPAQALQNSLIEFALQSNVTVIADNQLLQHHSSVALAGPMRTDSALATLLARTELGYEYLTDSDSYIIQPKKISVNNVLIASETIYPVEEITVTGVRYPFRYNTVTNTQTQGGKSYFDSSRFLNVLPQTLIQDQLPAELGDVLKYASGITPGDGASDTNDDVFIRGFQRHAIYLDGFRLSDYSGVKLSPVNTERIEILKGPATLFYGQAQPGGIVNVIRKKPQDTRFLKIESGAGSLGRQFINVDANGQAFVDSDINMRLVLSDDRQAESGEMLNIHQQFIAPSLEWKLTDNTSVNASYNYQSETRTLNRDFAVLLPIGDFPGANLSQLAAQAHENFSTEASLFNVELNHYFSPDWRLRTSYFAQQEKREGIRTTSDALLKSNILLDRNEVGNDFLALAFGGQLIMPIIIHTQDDEYLFSVGNIRSLYDEANSEFSKSVAINLEGSFAAGDIVHYLTLGGDWKRQDIYKQYMINVRNLFPGSIWSVSESDNATQTLLNGLLYNIPSSQSFEQQDLQLIYDDYGIYLQDNIELGSHWVVSAGTRYTLTEGEYVNVSDWTFKSLPDYRKFSSQLGLTYKPTDNHSIFVNYSEALRANYQNEDISLQSPTPELSDQFEVGLKSLLNNGKLLSSIAWFTIDKRNISTLKIVEGYRTSLEGHEQTVKGIDMDLTWQVSNALNVMTALSLINPKIVSGENAGRQPPLAAKKTASFFVHYKLSPSTNFKLGASHVGKRSGYSEGVAMLADESNPNVVDPLSLKAFTTLDAGIDYTFKLASRSPVVSISAKNLLDEEYYTAMLGSIRQNKSEGRSLVASIKVEF